jgi:hypothetical protein
VLYERLPPSPPLDPGIEDRPNVPHAQLYYQLGSGRGCKADHPVEVVVQWDGPDDRGDPAVHVFADVEDDRAAVCGTESAWWLRSTRCAPIIMSSHYPHPPFRLSLIWFAGSVGKLFGFAEDRRRRDVDPDRQRLAQFVAVPERWWRIQPGFVRGRLPLGRFTADVRGTTLSPTISPGRCDT